MCYDSSLWLSQLTHQLLVLVSEAGAFAHHPCGESYFFWTSMRPTGSPPPCLRPHGSFLEITAENGQKREENNEA